MRKILSINSVVCLFAIMNLNALSEDRDAYTCWDVADATEAAFNEANIKMRHIATHEAIYNVWVAAYDGCMGN